MLVKINYYLQGFMLHEVDVIWLRTCVSSLFIYIFSNVILDGELVTNNYMAQVVKKTWVMEILVIQYHIFFNFCVERGQTKGRK